MKPMSRPFAYLLLIGLFLPGSVALYGQQRTPEEAAAAFDSALAAKDWSRVAGLTHPDAVDEVAALIRKIAVTGTSKRKELAGIFGTAFSPDTLDRVEAGRIFALFLPYGMNSPAVAAMKETASRVIGVMPEGADLAHVLVRVKGMGPTGETEEVMLVRTLKLHGGEWKMVWEARLVSMKASLRYILLTSGGEE